MSKLPQVLFHAHAPLPFLRFKGGDGQIHEIRVDTIMALHADALGKILIAWGHNMGASTTSTVHEPAEIYEALGVQDSPETPEATDSAQKKEA